MIRLLLVASCDHCGCEFGLERFDGARMTHWSDERGLLYALGRAGWGLLFGDTDADTSVMCSECRQGGEE